MSDDGFGPPLRGSLDADRVDRTYEERWAGDRPSTPDFDAPVMRGRHRRLTGRRLLGTAAWLTLFAVLAGSLTAGALAVYASSQIRREPVEGLTGGAAALNVLVVGSDSREGFTPEELQALGTEAVDGRRTDTIFLLSIDGGRAAMLSFPRDLFVTHCDGAQGRINAAYARGGPSCLVRTVTGASGIGIDHYVEVNLFGFTRIVDAVGGVPIFLDEPLLDPAAGVNLPAGCHRLNGRQAVGFVRARSVDSDLGRIARQQRFIKSLAGEVISPSTLVNVPRLFRVAGSAGRTLTADSGLGVVELLQIARAARGLAGAGLATYTVPANAANIGGAAVLVPDSSADPLFARFIDGSVLDTPAEAEVRALQPGDVPVEVLNGAGVAGLAARVQDYLAARGFVVTGVGNAPPTDTTTVRHPPGQQAAARLVADQIPDARTAEDAGVDHLVLVLGRGVSLDAPPPPPMSEPPVAEDVPVGAAPVPEGCG